MTRSVGLPVLACMGCGMLGLAAIVTNKKLSVGDLQVVGMYRPWTGHVEELVRERGGIPPPSLLHVLRLAEMPMRLIALMAALDFVLMSAPCTDYASACFVCFAKLVPAFFVWNRQHFCTLNEHMVLLNSFMDFTRRDHHLFWILVRLTGLVSNSNQGWLFPPLHSHLQ
jgi:hypothetical protein